MTEPGGMHLTDYLAVLRRRSLLIGLTATVVAAVALIVSLLQIPVYQATARIILDSGRSVVDNNFSGWIDSARVQAEIEVISSPQVTARVQARVGQAPGVVATPVGQTAIIDLSVRSTSPQLAAEAANAYADAYIEHRREQYVGALAGAAKEIQRKIDDLGRQILQADARDAANRQPSAPAVRSRETDALLEQRAVFKQRLDQLQVDDALKSGGGPEVVTPASLPSTPVSPRPARNVVLGIITGLVFGVALAFIFEQLDDSVKIKADLERAGGGLPVLGIIPMVRAWRADGEKQPNSLCDSGSMAAESFRALRTSIQFVSADRSLCTIQVTSANSKEGKTTTVANLAVTFARAGKRVVVVDCDLRRPRLHRLFGLSNATGLMSVMVGDSSLTQAIQRVAGEPRLAVLSSGPLPANPSEVLGSKRIDDLLTTLKANADIVLVDSPPVLPVTDAAVLATKLDGVVVTSVAGSTSGRDLKHALETLRQVRAPIIGTVLGGATAMSSYGYDYRYGQDPETKGSPESKHRPSPPAGKAKTGPGGQRFLSRSKSGRLIG